MRGPFEDLTLYLQIELIDIWNICVSTPRILDSEMRGTYDIHSPLLWLSDKPKNIQNGSDLADISLHL